jgi:TPR repeat protein
MKTLRIAVVVIVAAAFAFGGIARLAAAGGTLNDGVAAYNRGDFATALQILTPLAEQGDAHAQDFLGSMYQEGQGVAKDPVAAYRWNRSAAELGIPAAQRKLGQMYWAGLGTTKDYAEALLWYERAAAQRDGKARFSLGYMYLNGQGVPRDPVKGMALYRQAADQGVALANYSLGFTYIDGTPKNPEEAYFRLSLALTGLPSGRFHDEATRALSELTKQISASDLAKLKARIDAWRPETQ